MEALDQLAIVLRQHLGISLSKKNLGRLRASFTAVGPKNQDDFASAVFLKALEMRSASKSVSEIDIVRSGWRVAKQLYRDALRTKSFDPSLLSAVLANPELPSQRLSADELALADRADPFGSAILSKRLEGYTLKQIATALRLPVTTVWESLRRVIEAIETERHKED